jgi:hypothetical protein
MGLFETFDYKWRLPSNGQKSNTKSTFCKVLSAVIRALTLLGQSEFVEYE